MSKFFKVKKAKKELSNFTVIIRRNVDDEVVDINECGTQQEAEEIYNNMLSNLDNDCYISINKLVDNKNYEEIKNSSLIEKKAFDVDYANVRKYTNKILELMDDGILDPRTVAESCLSYMSEDMVKDMSITEGYAEDYMQDEDEDEE